MKNYVMFVCETCGFQTSNLEEMQTHEAAHLGLTFVEYEQYNTLRSMLRYLKELRLTDDRDEVREKLEQYSVELFEFEEKHNIIKYKKNPKNVYTLSFGNQCTDLHRYHHYIGKTMYLYKRGICPDKLNGTIDFEEPVILEITVYSIIIDGADILIKDNNGKTYNINQCFMTKEAAEMYMQYEIDNHLAYV